MPDSLPQVNRKRQEQVYCEKIDIFGGLADDPRMKGNGAVREPALYIGEWMTVLGLKQKEIAKNSGLKRSYLNLLIKRKRDNPSLKKLQAIAGAMGLTIRDLQSPPPPQASIEAIQNIPADLVERLRARRKAS